MAESEGFESTPFAQFFRINLITDQSRCWSGFRASWHMSDDTRSSRLVAVKSDEKCSQNVATTTTQAVADGGHRKAARESQTTPVPRQSAKSLSRLTWRCIGPQRFAPPVKSPLQRGGAVALVIPARCLIPKRYRDLRKAPEQASCTRRLAWNRCQSARPFNYIVVADNGTPMKFHSHQLRDTFAVTQLLSGTTMQDLSKMLSLKSVKITERYYSPWVPKRQAALERRMAEALIQMGVSVSL
jgi:integrase